MAKASYLVTGGAGFIGSHLVEALLRQGHRVRVLDNLSTGKRSNLAHCTGVEFMQGDCADRDVAMRAARGMDYVLHQAALASVPRSVKDPAASNRANVDATLSVLLAARDEGVKRVVFAGSSSAYGDAAVMPKREDMPTAPLSPYALQKLVGEQYCAMFTTLYGLETVTTRYFNVFGPRQDPASPYSGVIALFASALLEGRSLSIYGDGEQTRDFTYVANVVDGVLRACVTPGVAGTVVNVAAGGRVSLNDLLRTMNAILGTDVRATYKAPRAGDVRDSQADITKAKALLGYSPSVHWQDGLARTLAWYREELGIHPVVQARASLNHALEEFQMSSIYLQLTAAGRYFSLSPLAAHLYTHCTAEGPCGERASHRLLSRRTASVSLLCDAHTEEWARENGVLPAAPVAQVASVASAEPARF